METFILQRTAATRGNSVRQCSDVTVTRQARFRAKSHRVLVDRIKFPSPILSISNVMELGTPGVVNPRIVLTFLVRKKKTPLVQIHRREEYSSSNPNLLLRHI